jgi:myo-inositol 2-dehydrogenase / D-chiro-inositol 1-dehydrogenase
MKLGVIGCGHAAAISHLPALRYVPEIEVVAVADIDPVRLQHVADRFHIRGRFTDHRSLLADPTIEAVAVCVPAQFHVEVALAVLDAEKHLFLEKPLALSLEEADGLMTRAATSPRKVMLGFNLRWHRMAQQARALIHQGTLGPLELVRSRLTSYHPTIPDWRKRRASGGGVFFEQAVHHFDLWRFLLQSEVEEVYAVSRSGQWEDETATLTARMANETLVAAIFAVHTSNSNDVEVYGRDGSLSFSFYRFDSLQYVAGGTRSDGIPIRLREMAHALREAPQGLSRLRRGGDFLASFQAEWRHFFAAIRDDTPVQCTLEDGRRALNVVLAAARSASWGRPVRVADVS